MKHRKQLSILLCMTLILTSVLGVIGTKPVESSAATYGIANPVTENGVTTWDTVYFGNYWQNDTNGDGTADQNDSKQPIRWRVLSVDGDDAFLLADESLDCQPYDTEYTDITWADCTLRTWLNNTFINTAFTSTEKGAIKNTTVVNDDNPYHNTEGGVNTTDKVYLLSIDEARNAAYGFNTEYRTESQTRQAKNTEYAKECGAWTSTSTEYEGNGYWWLRSPGSDSDYAAHVYYFGWGSDFGSYVVSDNYAVRPALHLSLSSSTLWNKGEKVSANVGEGSSGADASAAPTASSSSTTKPDDSSEETISQKQLSFGEDKSGSVSDETAQFFPKTWSLKSSLFPIEVSTKEEKDGTSTLKYAVGVGKSDMLKSDSEWSKYKSSMENFNRNTHYASLLSKYGGTKNSTFTVSKFKKVPTLSMMGYVEQKYDKNGNIISTNGKINPKLEWKGEVNWQFGTPIGPCYSTLSAKGSISGTLGPDFQKGKALSLSGTVNTGLEAALEGGYGINKVATIGVGGKLGADVQILPSSSCKTTASAFFHLYVAFLIDYNKDLATKKTILWDNTKSSLDRNLFNPNKKDDGWSCSTIDDSFAEHTSAWNTGKKNNTVKKMDVQSTFNTGTNETVLQEAILTSSIPIVKEINGTKVMVFQSYDSTRSELNRSVLMYSVCKDGTWTEPKALLDDGKADLYADMSVANGKLTVAWQKENNTVTGDISEDADSVLKDMAEQSEIYYAVFNETTGSFGSAVRLTDDNAADMMPKVCEGTDEPVITWVTNSDADFTQQLGTNTFYSKSIAASAAKEKILDTTKMVNEYVPYMQDNAIHIAYIGGDTAGETTSVHIETEQIVEEDVENSAFAGIQYNNGTVYYNHNGTMYAYSLAEKAAQEINAGESSIPGNAFFCKNGNKEGFVWIANDTDTGLAYVKASVKNADGFSEPVILYETDTCSIQYISPILNDNGEWEITANVADNTSGYNSLIYFSKSAITKLDLSDVEICENDVVDGKTAVNYHVTNNQLNTIQTLKLKITLEDGTEITQDIDRTIEPGESVDDVVYVDLGSIAGRENVSVQLYADGQSDLSNNEVSDTIGLSDIKAESTVEEDDDTATVTCKLNNLSDKKAETVLHVYSDEDKTEELYKSDTIELSGGESTTKTIEIDKSKLTYNSNNAVYLLSYAEVSAGDYDTSNNESFSVLYGAEAPAQTLEPSPQTTSAPTAVPNTTSAPTSSGTNTTVAPSTSTSSVAGVTVAPSQATVSSSDNKSTANSMAAPSRTTILSAVNKKGKKILLKIKKVSSATGYEIQYAPNKKFKKKKTKTTTKTSCTIKKLKKKKTYYIRVRAYKLVDGKKVYGTWSKVKKVKIKK